ncbi:MAG TPA: S41 family peptidase [Kofleriaceae bacterium]|jgi:C-terminal processing protease CtpA/Prc|nr:S41 family peptidase [Kofleriaceae bacterium]
MHKNRPLKISRRLRIIRETIIILTNIELTQVNGGTNGGCGPTRSPETKLVREELFSNTPAPGETVEIDLGRFRARVPIALYSTPQHTLGGTGQRADDPTLGAQRTGDGFDPSAGVADIIVVWNALQHFWPYWDVVHVDWSAALDLALRAALGDRSVEMHAATLERLLVAAPDGHVQVSCPGQPELGSPPFVAAAVPGSVVVIASEVPDIAPGDVVVAIDGRPIADAVAALEAQVSGSPQLRRAFAVARLGAGPAGTKLTVDVRRADRELRVELTRVDHDVYAAPHGSPIQQFDDGVYYLDLSRVSSAELAAVMTKLAAAPGLVIDLRDRPGEAAMDLLSHLLVRADDTLWEHVPLIIRPDSASHPAAWKSVGFALPALAPHIAGRVAILIGAETASYGESIAGLAAHYRVGELVGTDTAGVNGNVAQLALPTGCSVRFTGARVTRQDGSRFHLLGIPPTIRVEPTVAGIAAGRDEVMDRALDYVRTGKK